MDDLISVRVQRLKREAHVPSQILIEACMVTITVRKQRVMIDSLLRQASNLCYSLKLAQVGCCQCLAAPWQMGHCT